jgi:imidazolonepropionase
MRCDLLIHNIGELLTCQSNSGPLRGRSMTEIGLIRDGAVAISDGLIVEVGASSYIKGNYDADREIDAEGRVVLPGFVECHTHIVYGGNRLDEFELRIKGADYMEILAAGGGILSSVSNTRNASVEVLVASGERRLRKLVRNGVTTCEIKTGYGLDLETELKMLDAIIEIGRRSEIDVIPTFMPAHAIPPEFKGRSDEYVDLICDVMLPKVANSYDLNIAPAGIFVDVFCEKNAFDLAQSERILLKAKDLGFGIKAHVDEFTNLGGARMAIGLGAVSIDHLDAISDEEIELLSESTTVGVVTPTVNLNFGSHEFADARRLIDSGCAVALSTDFNPGSSPCPSPLVAMAISSRYQRLTPAEAVVAATINAAYAAGVGDTCGSIQTGKSADIVLFDSDDHRELVYEFGDSRVVNVIKKGRTLDAR